MKVVLWCCNRGHRKKDQGLPHESLLEKCRLGAAGSGLAPWVWPWHQEKACARLASLLCFILFVLFSDLFSFTLTWQSLAQRLS